MKIKGLFYHRLTEKSMKILLWFTRKNETSGVCTLFDFRFYVAYNCLI